LETPIMKTMQKGFTLIELMIVVAIIGILAAVAVPAYQDYTIKSKISEAASMASVVRTAIDVSYSEGTALGSMPATNAALGLLSASSYNAKYVSSVSTGGASGSVVVTLRSAGGLGLKDAAGGTVTYNPTALNNAGAITWTPTCSWGTKWCPKG